MNARTSSTTTGTCDTLATVVVPFQQVYTAFDRHLDALGVYKLDTVGDAFVVIAGLDGFKSKEASTFRKREVIAGTAWTPGLHFS